MFDLPGPLGTFANFLVIAAGFGFIIFIHELGHFLAAKWAGIRVLAFSIGFGQVVASYRKGVGLVRGSSEPQYRKRAYGLTGDRLAKLHEEISPTEYRLSMLPLGGYVKMLGQEDLNPDAVSSEPDSYQNCTVPKRMVVISAGVVMNVISAALLFIIVFMVGLKVFPAKVGFIAPDSPAASATVIGHDGPDDGLGIGLRRGDLITAINGKKMYSFEHIMPEIAMSRAGQPITITVQRAGLDNPIELSATPTKSPYTGLLDIGIDPPISTRLVVPKDEKSQRQFRMQAQAMGLGELAPGDRIVSTDGGPIGSPLDLLDLAGASHGNLITAQVDRGGAMRTVTIKPVAELQTGVVNSGDGPMAVNHVLGLMGVMMVQPGAAREDTKQGLMPGDVFARIGTRDFPSVGEGIGLIHAAAGQTLDLTVLRPDASGTLGRVRLSVKVTPEGTIGFYPASTTGVSNFVAMPVPIADMPGPGRSDDEDAQPPKPVVQPAQELIKYPGSRITRVGEHSIETLRDLPGAIVDATADAYARGDETFSIPVTLELPLPTQPDGSAPSVSSRWSLTRADIERMRGLGWTLPDKAGFISLFQYEQVIDKSPSPVGAIERGIAESRRVMVQTYLTFLRLFQGSVAVDQLKGPVGIAHLGTQIASQGFVWVLFFMALISINLAVINFLPLPIVDGGQFLMLLYEGIRGKPVPVVVQNIATMAGLLLIGTVFLYVTFNDVRTIFGV